MPGDVNALRRELRRRRRRSEAWSLVLVIAFGFWLAIGAALFEMLTKAPS